ncbi:MAG: hypothetical protein M3209_07985 [Acidobacteriota bacterium]|nr:hypothetical protein [Acidobacteriota bacterium]
MNDWYGLGFLVLLVLGAYLFLRQLSKPKKMTPEEFELRAAEGSGFAKIGVLELQKVLDPTAKKSIEVVQDLKGGKYHKKQAKGDDDSTENAVNDEVK